MLHIRTGGLVACAALGAASLVPLPASAATVMPMYACDTPAGHASQVMIGIDAGSVLLEGQAQVGALPKGAKGARSGRIALETANQSVGLTIAFSSTAAAPYTYNVSIETRDGTNVTSNPAGSLQAGQLFAFRLERTTQGDFVVGIGPKVFRGAVPLPNQAVLTMSCASGEVNFSNIVLRN